VAAITAKAKLAGEKAAQTDPSREIKHYIISDRPMTEEEWERERERCGAERTGGQVMRGCGMGTLSGRLREVYTWEGNRGTDGARYKSSENGDLLDKYGSDPSRRCRGA